jgi:MOSC domain-containing protein YiiM
MLSFGLQGTVERIFVAPYSGEPMQELESVEALFGCGLRGDRYVTRTGYWSGVDECHVTVIEAEVLERILEDTGLHLLNGEHRRNIVTRGIRLAQLFGKRVRIGAALFEWHKSRPPCAHLQAFTPAGTMKTLVGQRGGIGLRVIRSGLVARNDIVSAALETPRHPALASGQA